MEFQNCYVWSSWKQCFWMSCLESSQFGNSNTGTGCPEILWNIFKAWLDRVLGNLHWVILLEQGNWTRSSRWRGLFQSLPFYRSGIQCSLNRWKPRHLLEFENAACIWFQRTLFSFISYQVQFLSRLFIVNNVLPLFLFQVCFIQHECSHHLH